MRSISIVWRINFVFAAIIAVVAGAAAYEGSRIYKLDALTSVRDVSREQLETIRRSLKLLMMKHNNAGIRELVGELTKPDHSCGEILLVSHFGKVVTSESSASASTQLEQEAQPCIVCHSLENPDLGLSVGSHDEIVDLPDGSRALSVVIPILNERSCSTARCHAHPESDQVLGVLQARFSLEKVDHVIRQRYLYAGLAVLTAVFLSILMSWLTVEHLIGRRIRNFIEGTKKIAENDHSFRFEDPRGDEIGVLAQSFNEVTSKLSSSLSELRNTRDYLEAIVESSADIIITVNPSGQVETFNKGAEAALGYSRDEVIGQRIETLFADPRERDLAIARLRDTDNVVNYETHFLTKNGDIRNVMLTLSRLRAPDGTTIGTFGISKDVTREKRFQRELLLREKFAAIGQAVTGIQHSMKNMLNSMRGGAYMVNTALEDNDRELFEDGWAMVQEGITDTINLSSRMLQYVREWKPEIRATDLTDLLQAVVDGKQEAARKKGIDLSVETPIELPTIASDPRLLHSALVDLLSNALDACDQKDYSKGETPAVRLIVRYIDGSRDIVIEVHDNGEGITEEIKRNIFTPFFSTRRSLGTGMGLTLASKIIRLHAGSIEVESEANLGSTFRITLPVSGPQERKEDTDV